MLKKYAQEIADSTAGVIGYNVFITDMDGIIIGCSDPNRGLGILHEASLRVIKANQGECEDEEDAKRFRGTNPGVTYPIEEYPGKVVGTIAITGDPNKVASFAMIVKKQAEILLREKLLLESMINQQRTIENLISDIAAFKPGKTNEALLLDRACHFGFNPRYTYVALALELYNFEKYKSQIRHDAHENNDNNPELIIQSTQAKAFRHIRNVFSKPEDLCANAGDNKFVILRAASSANKRLCAKLNEEVDNQCQQVQDLFARAGFTAVIGIGSWSQGMEQISYSYRDAWQALLLGKKMKRRAGIYRIEDFRTEDLILNSDPKLLEQFVKKQLYIFRRQPDQDEMMATIEAWCRSGFSSARAAKELHIHRNTLDYRMNKIEHLTGINRRDFNSMVNLYLAVRLKPLFER